MTRRPMPRPLSVLLLASAITVLIVPAGDLAAEGGHGPRLAITSPRSGLTTTSNLVEVTVSLDSRGNAADTIVLMVNSVEADRLTLTPPADALMHTFMLDTSNYPEGVLRLKALATRVKRHKAIPVAHSEVTRLLLDRDISDGALVGPAGGELMSVDNGLTLTIPEGALRRPRRITVRPVDPSTVSLPDGAVPISPYELLPHGLQFDAPVRVGLEVPSTGLGEDGRFGHESAVLATSSEGTLEALDDQGVIVDGNSGQVRLSGTLSHFSTLFGAVRDEFEAWLTDVPEVVVVGQPFTIGLRVTDTEMALMAASLVLERRDLDLARVSPPPQQPDVVPVGQLRPGVADVFAQALTFRCDTPGVVVLDLVLGSPLEIRGILGPDYVARVRFRKRIFCGNAESVSGRVFGSERGSFEASVDPVQSHQRLAIPFTLRLWERADPSDFPVTVEIIDLTPGILEGPTLLSPEPAKLVPKTSTTDARVTDVYNGGTALQLLQYKCNRVGTALIVFRVHLSRSRHGLPGDRQPMHLLATVTCEPHPSQPMQLVSSPSDVPVPSGFPFSYAPQVANASGTTVWELLIRGANGEWTTTRPDNMGFDPATGQINWTPTSGQVGAFDLQLQATDTLGRQAVQVFTVTVVGAPIPATTVVPSFAGLTRDQALALAIVARLTLGTISEIVDPLQPVNAVVSQFPLEGSVVAIGSVVNLVINVLHAAGIPVVLPEGLHNTTTFNLPPGNRITIAGSNGFAVVDAITGEIPTAGTSELSFTNNGLGPFFGALVLEDPLGSGGDTIFAYGLGTALTMFDPVANQMGMWQVSTNRLPVTDAIHFGGDPAAPGGLFVHFAAREIVPLVPVDLGASRIFTSLGRLAERDAFASAPAGPVSAFAWDLQFNSDASLSTSSEGRVLTVTDGSPGRIYLVNPATPSSPATDIGAAGNSPRQMRCAPTVQLCAVSSFDSDSLTIVRWDGRAAASIVGTVTVGDGPIGIGIVADGVNARVISPGFNDNSYTVTTLAGDGTVLANTTQAAPASCINPGHAIWLTNRPGTAVLSCNGSDTYAVVTP